jgi:LysR family glycine cleavage system transcriptional activator
MDRIRNIKSLQIFGVVSHTRNLTRAAKLLNTSQSAVSYHIKKLETDLSVALFRRTASGLELTPEGALLSAHVDQGLGAIRAGLEQITARAGSVKVALLPMFASRWLSSRLGELLETYPALQLSIQSHNNSYAKLSDPQDFADMGIQWGRGRWEGFHATRLWPETLVVVCSPAYLRAHPIVAPADIARCTVLHVDDEAMWAEWFARNGLKLSGSQAQMTLEDRHFQLSSTINGLGVSLFASWLVRGELQSAELADPFQRAFDTDFAYHLIVPKGAELAEPAKRFKAWLLGLSHAF